MGLQPNIARRRSYSLKTCSRCKVAQVPDEFAPTKSPFFEDGSLTICNSCIKSYLESTDYDWGAVNKLCQYADIPWIPKEWEKLREMNQDNTFFVYASLFAEQGYEDLGWEDYYKQFSQMKASGELETQLPGLDNKRRNELQKKWGPNYSDEQLEYLETLFNGLMTTQNVNGTLQIDQALKVCKMSLEIDSRIREGADFDKILASYDKLVKIAEFTPKNVKNINDFDSVGELIKWLEKKGWKNNFYDGVTRDIVDETIKNFQNFNQRLYTNETGIGDEITQRLRHIKEAREIEEENDNYYGTDKEYDLDSFDNEGYEGLYKEEEFNPAISEED